MSYNKYNTRNSSGRYNTPGQFVPATEQPPGPPPSRPPPQPRAAPPPPTTPFTNPPAQQVFAQAQAPRTQNLQMIQTQDVDMKVEPGAGADAASEAPSDGTNGGGRPHWMKSKLPGVKKLSNKERRRRQNENLRKLLTPKNALMVLNEMMPNEQLANQFKVEPAANFNHQYFSKASGQYSFCADLTLDGNTYKGYGENKLTARNAAAEQAIRDLIIKKMVKVMAPESGPNMDAPLAVGAGASGGGGGEAEAEGGEAGAGDDEALPMIQLASFALHKLFSEWEYEGHKVPQLKPQNAQISESVSESGVISGIAAVGVGGASGGVGVGGGGGGPKPRPPRKVKELPANAAGMHPCMLLTYMRPHLEYRELAVEGDRPQTMTFTLGVDVDGATYIGKASNKKEARKMAAKAACQALFSVRFDEVHTSNKPE